MAKRRKRRSQKGFDIQLARDLRAKRVQFLRDLSEMVSNTVGVRIRCVFDGGDVVTPRPRKKAAVSRRVAHIAGYQEDPSPEMEPRPAVNLPDDGLGPLTPRPAIPK